MDRSRLDQQTSLDLIYVFYVLNSIFTSPALPSGSPPSQSLPATGNPNTGTAVSNTGDGFFQTAQAAVDVIERVLVLMGKPPSRIGGPIVGTPPFNPNIGFPGIDPKDAIIVNFENDTFEDGQVVTEGAGTSRALQVFFLSVRALGVRQAFRNAVGVARMTNQAAADGCAEGRLICAAGGADAGLGNVGGVGSALKAGTRLIPTAASVKKKISRGVRSIDELDAVRRPLEIGPVRIDELGRRAQRFVGRRAEVVVNPDTGRIPSVNPTSTKKAERLLRRLDVAE